MARRERADVFAGEPGEPGARDSHLEVVAAVGDVLLRPEPADEVDELPGAGIPLVVAEPVAEAVSPFLFDLYALPANIVQSGRSAVSMYDHSIKYPPCPRWGYPYTERVKRSLAERLVAVAYPKLRKWSCHDLQ